MDAFYLFLYCGDSMSTHVDNHAGDFVVDLPKRYLLEGNWECALTELTLSSQLEYPSHRLYVCADIVEESYARNRVLPLLRVIEPVDQDPLEFGLPYYVKLRNADLNRLRFLYKRRSTRT